MNKNVIMSSMFIGFSGLSGYAAYKTRSMVHARIKINNDHNRSLIPLKQTAVNVAFAVKGLFFMFLCRRNFFMGDRSFTAKLFVHAVPLFVLDAIADIALLFMNC